MASLSLLFDTNVCIHLLDRTNPHVLASYREALLSGEEIFVSAISHFELMYGVAKSAFPFENSARLGDVLQTFTLLPFEEEDAAAAASLRVELQRKKQPIGPYDTLIAGQALARNLVLVTANIREFSRVDGLKWVDWSE